MSHHDYLQLQKTTGQCRLIAQDLHYRHCSHGASHKGICDSYPVIGMIKDAEPLIARPSADREAEPAVVSQMRFPIRTTAASSSHSILIVAGHEDRGPRSDRPRRATRFPAGRAHQEQAPVPPPLSELRTASSTLAGVRGPRLDLRQRLRRLSGMDQGKAELDAKLEIPGLSTTSAAPSRPAWPRSPSASSRTSSRRC